MYLLLDPLDYVVGIYSTESAALKAAGEEDTIVGCTNEDLQEKDVLALKLLLLGDAEAPDADGDPPSWGDILARLETLENILNKGEKS